MLDKKERKKLLKRLKYVDQQIAEIRAVQLAKGHGQADIRIHVLSDLLQERMKLTQKIDERE